MKTEINVLKIAKLAKLEINKDKLADFEHDMQEIVAFAGILSEADFEYIIPDSKELDCFRDDIPENAYDGASLISASPQTEEDCICVPKVIE